MGGTGQGSRSKKTPMMSKYSFSTTLQTFIDQNSGACDEDAPDSVEAVLSGCETKQEGQEQVRVWKIEGAGNYDRPMDKQGRDMILKGMTGTSK